MKANRSTQAGAADQAIHATSQRRAVLPVVLVSAAAFMVMRSVPNSREDPEGKFDVVGALSSVVAVVGFIFLLHEGPERGWTGSSPYSRALIRSAQESFVDGWQQAMWVGVAVMAVLLIYVLARGPEAAASNESGRPLEAAVAPVNDA
ncbi:hypothetical protein BE04_33070 [Sorangium cellulosum]|uniref:Uncharacterized protein n=2 Tax=Sorangium cellulosum TaxID=56 RepID=A0A150PYT1_SORCE|nr:hypothetical protein [Sorangium cellulosum]AGP38307.1 hypothetical protein SCE1572_29800 [Sorangium cellulosum So0157-2]KYF60921.1 hypothetical protein BE04_33070 [Sorangium cellulosum]